MKKPPQVIYRVDHGYEVKYYQSDRTLLEAVDPENTRASVHAYVLSPDHKLPKKVRKIVTSVSPAAAVPVKSGKRPARP